MAFTIIIKEEAHEEAVEAFNYYEEKQPGLGDRFLRSLESVYKNLYENPQHYGYINEDTNKIFRDVKLKKFPYVVVFEIMGSNVIVYAVHCCYKNPMRKLPKR